MDAQSDVINQFWKWFTEHEPALFMAAGSRDLFDELLERLRTIHESLTYQCGPEGEAPRELIFSADGIKEAFSAVEATVDAAPTLSRWRFTRFRPRVEDYAGCRIDIGTQVVRGEDIEYVITSDGVLLGLHLFVRGCNEDDDRSFLGVAFLFLDSALGEYDMECKVGALRVHAWNSTVLKEHRRPFSELREHFDDAFERLCQQNGE